jgi:predicted Zn-dependent protease with MMP-like domain
MRGCTGGAIDTDGPSPVGVRICAAAGSAAPTIDSETKPAIAPRVFADMGCHSPIPASARLKAPASPYAGQSPISTKRHCNDGAPLSRYKTLMDDPASDPLVWRRIKAPSLVELEILAAEVFRHLPRRFRDLCADVVIQLDDFPSEEVLDQMGAESEFDLLGLFQGVGLPFRAESAPVQMPNMIWLYRRPIIDYWAEHDETLGAIVKHVLVHEIGHHFGLSDADMAAIESSAE